MRVIYLLKKYGFIGLIRKAIIKWLKLDKTIEKQQEAIDSLYYYMNNYVITDLSLLPPTNDPDLRIMQKCDTALLLIFDRICRKHNIDYWLDFGTLLGSVRHHGFIPWDDDMDVACLSKDYYKLLNALKEELPDKDFNIEDDNEKPMGRIGFGYKHHKTGIWIDICPVDIYYTNEKLDKVKNEILSKRESWKIKYSKYKKKASIEELLNVKKAIFGNNLIESSNNSIYHHGCEFPHQKPIICEKNIIYPLVELTFEDYHFRVPNNYKTYLKLMYGNNFMLLPKSGILHHGAERGKLSTWAKTSHIDMNEVYNYLIQTSYNIKK